MAVRKTAVTLHGKPVTLVGNTAEVGQAAPRFIAVDQDLAPVSSSVFLGRPCILSSVVSLDTPVCDMETRRFNKEATALSPDMQVLTISMDLPFAQKRWCAGAGIDRVIVLSDHLDASFGVGYGLLIKDLRLLARAVFVIDRKGIIRHAQVVPEVTQEPDYAEVLAAARALS